MSPSQTSSRNCTRGCASPWNIPPAPTCGSRRRNWLQPIVLLGAVEEDWTYEANAQCSQRRSALAGDYLSCTGAATAAVSDRSATATTGAGQGATPGTARNAVVPAPRHL